MVSAKKVNKKQALYAKPKHCSQPCHWIYLYQVVQSQTWVRGKPLILKQNKDLPMAQGVKRIDRQGTCLGQQGYADHVIQANFLEVLGQNPLKTLPEQLLFLYQNWLTNTEGRPALA